MHRWYKIALQNSNEAITLYKRIVKYLVVLVVTIVLAQYLQTDIYDFEAFKAYEGKDFYNPYAGWQANKVQKANFHAHSKAWLGLSNGHNEPAEILNAYAKLGYGIASVSNYHHIEASRCSQILSIPTYEHGFNLAKSHLLAIDASHTCNLDFSLWQNTSQKQQRIHRLQKDAGMIALAHPGLRNGISVQDVLQLSGYTFMEVLSPYYRSFYLWDRALMCGHVSWLLANDDTHHLGKQPPGKFFNLIGTKSQNKDTVIQELRKGNHVGYASANGYHDVQMNFIKLQKNRVRYSFEGKQVQCFAIINGHKISLPKCSQITLHDSVKYVRFEALGEKSSLYTNPIYRCTKGKENIQLAAFQSVSISKNKTRNYRLGIIAVWSILIVISNAKRLIMLWRWLQKWQKGRPSILLR